MPQRLILASQSPRRKQLLEQLAPLMGLEVVVLKPDAAEDAEALEIPKDSEDPRAYVERVTRAKLSAGLSRAQRHHLEQLPVLASDTTVALGGEIFGKPADAADAMRMLRRLSGQVHEVLTAVAVASRADEAPLLCLSTSQVKFAPLSEAWMEWVVQTGEPMDKAGGYAIQGHAGAQIEWVRGSPSGIMGLPLYETQTLLQTLFQNPA